MKNLARLIYTGHKILKIQPIFYILYPLKINKTFQNFHYSVNEKVFFRTGLTTG